MQALQSFDFGTSGGGTAVLDPPQCDAALARNAVLDGGGFPPPFDGDGGDGGGGGGWGEGGDEADDAPEPGPEESAAFGLGLILAGVTTLFVIFLTAVLVLRSNANEWPPAGSPDAPLGLWGSTLVLLASSFTIARAVRAARARDHASATRSLAMTLALGGLFLAVQTTLWGKLASHGFFPSSNGYGTVFYTLTGMHALHIVGGLIYLCVVLGRHLCAQGREMQTASESVPLCAVYWHFMGGIWVVLAAAIWA